MTVVQQRVAARDHEDDRVHVDDRLLHLDRADAEHVAHEHDGEHDQHEQEGEPGDGDADRFVQPIDGARHSPDGSHRSSPIDRERDPPVPRMLAQPYWNGSERAL